MGPVPHHKSESHLLPTALGWWAQRLSEEVVGMLGVGNILGLRGWMTMYDAK